MTDPSPRDLDHAKLEDIRKRFLGQGSEQDAAEPYEQNGRRPSPEADPVPGRHSSGILHEEFGDALDSHRDTPPRVNGSSRPKPPAAPAAESIASGRDADMPYMAAEESSPGASSMSDADLIDILHRISQSGSDNRIPEPRVPDPVAEEASASPQGDDSMPHESPVPSAAFDPASEEPRSLHIRDSFADNTEWHQDPTDLSAEQFTLTQQRKKGPQQGWRRAVSRLGIPVDKSEDEKRYDHDVDCINKQLRYSRVVGVAGFKGGTGKTSMSVCLGSTLGRHRREGMVVALDTDEKGTLVGRMKGKQRSSVKAFAIDQNLHTANDVRAHMTFNAERFGVIGSSSSPTAAPLSSDEYRVALNRLKQDYAIVLVDMDTSAASPVYESVMRSLDALVLVISPTVESVTLGQRMMSWLREHDLADLKPRTLVLINHNTPAKAHLNLARVVSHFRDHERLKVLDIPWDEHLSEAGEINIDLLDRPTRRRFVRAAARLVDKLPSS